MKKSIFLFCFLLLGIYAQSQATFEVPQNVELQSAEDFAKYAPAIVEAAKWLEQTDLDKETEKRQQANEFVIQWISGNQDMSVDVTGQLGRLYDGNEQLLPVYLANYARNFLENKSATKLTAKAAGLSAMMNVYGKGIAIKKNKEMDKAIKIAGSGSIDAYVKEHM